MELTDRVHQDDAAADALALLTDREQEVAEQVAAGLTTEEIAAALHISPHTVITHVRHVYEKWGVTSRHELRARFSELRWGR